MIFVEWLSGEFVECREVEFDNYRREWFFSISSEDVKNVIDEVLNMMFKEVWWKIYSEEDGRMVSCVVVVDVDFFEFVWFGFLRYIVIVGDFIAFR